MINYLKNCGLNFKNNKIVIPKWCKRIKIDIGLSSNAPHTQTWLENQSDLIVFGFEPVQDNYLRIISGEGYKPKNFPKDQKFIKLDKKLIGKRAFVFPFALGNVVSSLTREMYVTANDKGCSSFYKPKWPRVVKKIKTRVLSLDYFVNMISFDEKLNFIEHIKSDCQGSDFDILKGGIEALKKTAVYTIEAENRQYFETDNDLKKITLFFKKKNFLRYNLFNKFKYFSYLNSFTVTDPTFFNVKFIKKFKKINIYQHG
jgi:hypothetical protein